MHGYDTLIRSLYSLAVLEDGQGLRTRLLNELCQHLGASGAAWLTRLPSGSSGEFTVCPPDLGLRPETLAQGGNGDGRLTPLPGLPQAIALRYAHDGQPLVSTVGLWFPASDDVPDPESLQRLMLHLVSAEVLGRQTFVRRDEWLASFGRTSRGSAALVDADGAIYAASEQFLALLREVYGEFPSGRLPFALPELRAATDNLFSDRDLRYRLQPHGDLRTLHARRALPLDELSPREQEIARALGKGKTFKSVAREKGIAVSTVANHASRIYRKLGIYRREDLVEIVRMPRRPPSSAGAH